MKKLFQLFLLGTFLSALCHGQNAGNGPVTKKTSGANANDINEDLNVGTARTLQVKSGGTLNGAGTFDFSGGTPVFGNNQIPWAKVTKSGSSLADLTTRLFADLQSKPTTAAGYGITNGANLDAIAGLSGSALQVLRRNAANNGYEFATITGNQVLYGTGVPSGGTGSDGDTFVSTDTGNFYKKASGAWGSAQSRFQLYGAGFVTGPGSTTDKALVIWNGTGGTAISNSSILFGTPSTGYLRFPSPGTQASGSATHASYAGLTGISGNVTGQGGGSWNVVSGGGQFTSGFAGTLSTRTSNTAGTLTLTGTGTGLTTGATIRIVWAGGVVTSATAGTVTSGGGNTTVPFTGATGTILPAASTAVYAGLSTNLYVGLTEVDAVYSVAYSNLASPTSDVNWGQGFEARYLNAQGGMSSEYYLFWSSAYSGGNFMSRRPIQFNVAHPDTLDGKFPGQVDVLLGVDTWTMYGATGGVPDSSGGTFTNGGGTYSLVWQATTGLTVNVNGYQSRFGAASMTTGFTTIYGGSNTTSVIAGALQLGLPGSGGGTALSLDPGDGFPMLFKTYSSGAQGIEIYRGSTNEFLRIGSHDGSSFGSLNNAFSFDNISSSTGNNRDIQWRRSVNGGSTYTTAGAIVANSVRWILGAGSGQDDSSVILNVQGAMLATSTVEGFTTQGTAASSVGGTFPTSTSGTGVAFFTNWGNAGNTNVWIANYSGNNPAVYFVNYGGTISGSNYALAGNNSGTTLNSPSGGTLRLRVGNGDKLTLTSSTFTVDSGYFAANGSVATAMSSLGPSGSHTTVQKWLVVNDGSTSLYVPAF